MSVLTVGPGKLSILEVMWPSIIPGFSYSSEALQTEYVGNNFNSDLSMLVAGGYIKKKGFGKGRYKITSRGLGLSQEYRHILLLK